MKSLLLVDKNTSTLINDTFLWKKNMFKKFNFPNVGEYNLSNFIKIKQASIRSRSMIGKNFVCRNQNLSLMPFISALVPSFVGFDDVVVYIKNKHVEFYRKSDTMTKAFYYIGYREIKKILFELYYFGNIKKI